MSFVLQKVPLLAIAGAGTAPLRFTRLSGGRLSGIGPNRLGKSRGGRVGAAGSQRRPPDGGSVGAGRSFAFVPFAARATSFESSRSQSTELATAAQSSQSEAVRLTVEKASCRKGT